MPKNERALPDGFMTVGKLAERMGVTVRTLQYYDREGLLSPTAESGGGRRLYTDKDMIQLHQCCFSERMRKLFRKNEKNVLRFCNKKAKEKRRLQRVKKPM